MSECMLCRHLSVETLIACLLTNLKPKFRFSIHVTFWEAEISFEECKENINKQNDYKYH